MPHIYKDPGFKPAGGRLDNAEYERALRAFPIPCVDVIFINRARRFFYLAERVVEPARGWWWVGGRMYQGESYEETAIRKVRDETSVVLTPDRLIDLKSVARYFWSVRQQEPRDVGCDCIGFMYAAELTADELTRASAGLVNTEYRPNSLTAFDRRGFEGTNVRPTILDHYALVFP